MKELEDVVACVVDYGKFILLAECVSHTYAKTQYHSPISREFLCLNDCAKGRIPNVTRVDSFMDPHVIASTDLFIFPDIGYGPEQRYLRSIGKAVWGHMGVSDLELSRTRFLDFLKEAGLPMVESVVCHGLAELAEHLRPLTNKWIKINRFRGDMETWKWIDWEHHEQKLKDLAVKFGGLEHYIVFVIQDEITGEDVVELGYDGWSIDGAFPEVSYQGYEAKNELYLGSLLKLDQLPEQVRQINEAMTPMLREAGYRDFLATELRVKDGVPNFIDPTFRMAGLTQDQLPKTCTNLAQVIWEGANGQLTVPQYAAPFVATATMHYKGHVPHQPFTLKIPEAAEQWVKLYHYCHSDGLYHFLPSIPYECDEAGVIIGMGDSALEAIRNLNQNFALLQNEPLSIDAAGFVDLLEQVEAAESQGVEFSDQPVPDPVEAIT